VAVDQNEDWSLVGCKASLVVGPDKLWNFDKHTSTWRQGAGGIGYNAPHPLARPGHKKYGRFSVNIQTDAISTSRRVYCGLPRITRFDAHRHA